MKINLKSEKISSKGIAIGHGMNHGWVSKYLVMLIENATVVAVLMQVKEIINIKRYT